jgi:hypothetical protein
MTTSSPGTATRALSAGTAGTIHAPQARRSRRFALPFAGAVAGAALGLALLAPGGVVTADTATPTQTPRLDPVAPRPRAYECREYLAEVIDRDGDGQGVVRLVWKYDCRPIY